MTFTYTAGLATKANDIRLLVGDTDDQAQPELRLEDEEIARIITLEGALHTSAARAAEVLAAKFARKAEGSAGPDRIMPSGRAMELRMLASRLRTQSAALAIPSAGGISISQKSTAEADTDRVQQPFSQGMFDNPEAAGSDVP